MKRLPILAALSAFLISSVFGAGNAFYAAHLTANGTTTVTSTTAYVKSIAITCTTAGTTETIAIKNKEGTPKFLYQSGTLTVGSPLVLTFAANAPVQMTGGIDIVYAGAGAGVVDVFICYE
jgi:hypothetical protein